MTRTVVIGALALAASTAAAPGQDVGAGETSFRSKCQICHDVGEGAKNKLGPPLNGLDGRKAGTLEAILSTRD
jgi:cytochrome c